MLVKHLGWLVEIIYEDQSGKKIDAVTIPFLL